MLVGNLLALRQRQVVRILAYSSIAHMGYLLVALIAAGALGIEAVGFYLAAAGVDASLRLPVGVLVAASVTGLFYYLRIIFALYGAPPGDAGMVPALRPPTLAGGTALAALTLALLVLGTWPEPAIEIVRVAIARSTPL